jgi:hypothetical protein
MENISSQQKFDLIQILSTISITSPEEFTRLRAFLLLSEITDTYERIGEVREET